MATPSRPRVIRLMPVLDFGGVESRIVTQAALIDHQRLDYRVCTFWKKGAAALKVEELGVRVDCLDVDPSPKNPRATARLYEYLQDSRADVVHASILEANVHAALNRRLPGAASVAIEEVGMPQRRLAARVAFGAVYRLADVVIGVSQRTCEALRSEHHLPSGKVRLVYNSVSPLFLEPCTPLPDRRRFRFLAVGRLVEVKNHETLLRAFKHTATQLPDVELHLAGEGPLREKLELLVRELGLEGRVTLLGFQSDVRKLLDDADAYVIPSFSEGTSISLAEAMARSRPFVASFADGINEAVDGYPAGWQVKPTDEQGWASALKRLAGLSRRERLSLGETARRVVEARMSPAGYARTLNGLYDELAGLTAARRGRFGPLSTASSALARLMASQLR